MWLILSFQLLGDSDAEFTADFEFVQQEVAKCILCPFYGLSFLKGLGVNFFSYLPIFELNYLGKKERYEDAVLGGESLTSATQIRFSIYFSDSGSISSKKAV